MDQWSAWINGLVTPSGNFIGCRFNVPLIVNNQLLVTLSDHSPTTSGPVTIRQSILLLYYYWGYFTAVYRVWKMCFETSSAFTRCQPDILFYTGAQPILEYRWIASYTQPSLLKTQLKIAIVYLIYTQSLSWYSTGLVPNVQPPRDEGSGKPWQSIEPHRILAPTWYLNQGPPGPQSRVVTTTLPLHAIGIRACFWWPDALLASPGLEKRRWNLETSSAVVEYPPRYHIGIQIHGTVNLLYGEKWMLTKFGQNQLARQR